MSDQTQPAPAVAPEAAATPDVPETAVVEAAIAAAPAEVKQVEAIVHDVKSDPVAAESKAEVLLPALVAQSTGIVKEAKAGYKTTEFWLTIASAVLLDVGALPVPDHIKAYATAGLAAVYTISRAIAKHGVGDEQAV